MRQEKTKIRKDKRKRNPVLKFILRSCITTLLVLGLIGVFWYYPHAIEQLAPDLGVDTITFLFYAAVIGIVLGILFLQLYARFWRPSKIEKAIDRHVEVTLQKLAMQKSANHNATHDDRN
jgi:hypothetical protein